MAMKEGLGILGKAFLGATMICGGAAIADYAYDKLTRSPVTSEEMLDVMSLACGAGSIVFTIGTAISAPRL